MIPPPTDSCLGSVVVVGSGAINTTGSPSCRYLELMPELFPGTTKASLRSHMILKRKGAHASIARHHGLIVNVFLIYGGHPG